MIVFGFCKRHSKYLRKSPLEATISECPFDNSHLLCLRSASVSHHLVIVESPTKAKTIKRFLGKDFAVEASMGHIRDLPERSLAVDVENDFEPVYEIPKEKQAAVKRLRDLFKKSDDLWIATDVDREGEAIGWHLTQVLGVKNPKSVKRIVFHEITEDAIKEAVQSPRRIDMKLVDAQQARRILDRLVGYTLSPFLWKKVYRGLSAGRVQSVAVRIIVDREREIRAFIPQEYWSITAQLETKKDESFSAELQRKNSEKIVPKSEAEAQTILRALEGAAYSVLAVEEKDIRRTPPPPFTTSTLQQEAGRKLEFSVKQTMFIAQQLYEGVNLGKGDGHVGLITYMRTDSVNLSEKALSDAKRVIAELYGREYVLSEPRTYKAKSRLAQEAHEAIRPTDFSRTPKSLASVLDHQQLKLYTLIWNRTMATQMPVAELKRIGVDIVAGRPASSATTPRYTFRATGQTVLFDGYLRVYEEGRDDEGRQEKEEAELGEKLLPTLKEGDTLKCLELLPEQHFTKPLPRYTEASLVKKLEEEGIGRPSTYAPTISTIIQRGYIRKDGKQLVPEDIAFTVTDLLAKHFKDIVDLEFTARMEESLDDIAEGKMKSVAFLRSFHGPFQALVAKKSKEIQKTDILKERVLGKDPATGLEVIAREGRYGPYVQLGKFDPHAKRTEKPRSVSLPKALSIDAVTLTQALALLAFPKELGTHEGSSLILATGRFGPYIKCGKISAALPKGCDLTKVTLSEAIALLAERSEARRKAQEPLRTLGNDPTTGGMILVKAGRFGPYVTDGKINASIPRKLSPDAITLDEAANLLSKKRIRGPSRWRRRSG